MFSPDTSLPDGWQIDKDLPTDPEYFYDHATHVTLGHVRRRRSPERIAAIENQRRLDRLTAGRFSPTTSCVKCGSTDARCCYHSEEEMIVRTCDRCGHVWRELPLDAEEVRA